MHSAALPGGRQHPRRGRLDALMRVRDHQLHAREATADKITQKRGPERLRLGSADRHAQHFAAAIGVHAHRDRHGDRHDPATLADLEIGRVDPEVGPFALDRCCLTRKSAVPGRGWRFPEDAGQVFKIKIKNNKYGLCFGRGGLSFSTGEIRGIWAWRGLVQALMASGANTVQTVVSKGFYRGLNKGFMALCIFRTCMLACMLSKCRACYMIYFVFKALLICEMNSGLGQHARYFRIFDENRGVLLQCPACVFALRLCRRAIMGCPLPRAGNVTGSVTRLMPRTSPRRDWPWRLSGVCSDCI